MAELKPCPCCGCEAEYQEVDCEQDGFAYAAVICTNCTVSAGLHEADGEDCLARAKKQAAETWNTRRQQVKDDES